MSVDARHGIQGQSPTNAKSLSLLRAAARIHLQSSFLCRPNLASVGRDARADADAGVGAHGLCLLHRILELDPRAHLVEDELLVTHLAAPLPDHGIDAGLAEEWHTEALGAGAAHAVQGGDKSAAAHLRHQVAHVDDHAARDVRSRDPGAVRVAHLQSAGGVLVQQGQQPRVGMRRAAQLLHRRFGLVRIPRRGGIVQEAKGGNAVAQDGGEGGGVLAKRRGQENQEGVCQGRKLAVEGLEALAGREDRGRRKAVGLCKDEG